MNRAIKLIISLCCMLCITGVAWQAHAAISQPEYVWRRVQEKAKDTVVQLFVQTSIFNWLQPFKSPDYKKTFGSGFFIDDQGHLISNFHVVEDASGSDGVKIQIPSFGKEQFDVNIVGVCPSRDLALLKLTDEARKKIEKRLGRIPFLPLGDSDTIVRTQDILALGYPLGQEKLKSTQGIVSGREMAWGESYIQITAALNPGNSGGPSLDRDGKVIGINAARVRKAQGVGYIIPIDDVKGVIRDLHRIKLLRTPMLGGEFNYATDNTTKFLNNPQPGGLYISRVYKDTLFERFGVLEGDMIYTINGYKIDMYGETNAPWSEDKVPVFALLNRFEIGKQVAIQLYRRGVPKSIQFTFEITTDLPIRRYYQFFEPIDYEIVGGMVIMQLTLNHFKAFEDIDATITDDLLKYLKRENQYEPRLVITHVFPTSQAQEARCVNIGHIISHVNEKPVHTLADMRNVIKETSEATPANNFVTFKTDEKKFMVISLKRMLEDEERLSARYLYKKTDFIAGISAAVAAKGATLPVVE